MFFIVYYATKVVRRILHTKRECAITLTLDLDYIIVLLLKMIINLHLDTGSKIFKYQIA